MGNTITFLGTGTSQGIPMIGCKCEVCSSSDERDKRLRTSALVIYEGVYILIDAGPDFRQQMLRENISHLDAIILTHQHKDHTGGLDDVRALNYLEKCAVPIYCEKRVEQSLRMEYSYVFAQHKYPGIPEFNIKTIDETPFTVTGANGAVITITPIRVMHYHLPILGFRFGGLVYITDANFIADEEYDKLTGASLFVINTVKRTTHISHYSLPEAISIAKRVGAQRSYITHLSHQLPPHEQLKKELSKQPFSIEPAYDGLALEF
jgi:phosphoribosyl 1,2-cyclic phosphate phosphodiesterase